ncbi:MULTISPECIES: GNAT family N-acetyltransferase [Halolamina]|uniref:Acetyltransferase (GNAT) domain-containing protein n=1 Tax=Halolamina pelagica TaxID=699431 RepID=A0A1I5MGK7_9EURY|nr:MULTISPECIES: GNAT family N-acetyltransferase [Halolamina]NHX35992.1 GNAT family N-acetyltransferase [Halolamina sp. R1-12]SFP08076.1 Acetyltransferase (GNAT) domain-containing protein [Halolamina pelagica]
MLAPDRVAAAEYAKRRVLAEGTDTRFGTFVHDPAHADRAAATQLLDARLPPADAPNPPERDPAARALLARLDTLFDRHERPHRVVTGVDAGTAARLAPLARARGYEREDYWALAAHRVDAPAIPDERRLETRSHGSDAAGTVHESVGRDPAGVAYAAEVASALGGQEVVAFRDGDPVGAAGWYIHGGADDPVARLTHVGVRPAVQNEGVGSTLVRAVVDRCPLPADRIVVCATADRAEFYERLGFVRNNALWRFARLP